MGMMARMRGLASWFIITVGGLFVIFMVFSDTRMGGLFGKNEVVVGKIAGEDVTAQEFSTAVEGFIKQQESQTGKKVEEDQMDYYRDQCWNQLVAKKILEKKLKDLNIIVSDQEIKDILLGANPPAELAQNFIDSTGKFDRALYERTIKDPKVKDQIIMFENYYKKILSQQKLQSYVNASINISEDEMRRQYEDQAVKMRADYVLFDINTVPDAEIKVADDDLRNYYNKHMSEYKMDAQRKIKYVLFPKKATAQDSTRIRESLVKNIAKLQKDTTSLKSLIGAYSDYPYSQDTINVTALPAQAKNVLFNAKVNEFVGPVATSEGYTVYHLVARVKGKEPVVRASHILIRTGSDEKAAKAKADDVYSQLQKGGNFAELAKKYSEDPGSAANGGDAGWGSKGSWVKEFEEAAFSGKAGVIQKPVKSSFGYHIIKVTDRSDDRFVVEKITNKIQPSTSTTAKITRSANDLVKLAKEGDFQKQAEMMKLNVVETPAFAEKPNFIPGLGYLQSIVRFAFDNGAGTVSDVYRIASGYIVAYVSADIKAGVKPFEEEKETIKTAVIKQKKLEKMMKMAADAKSKLGGGDLKAISNFYPNLKADTTTEFSGTIYPNVGRDFAFIHYCKTAELNKVSEPVKGLRGAYLIKPTSRTQFSQQDYTAQRNSIRDKILQNKKGQVFNQWLTAIRDDIKIVDDRYKYFKQ
jgi:peptidyl-prolyl cis-trans isomerase D